MWHDKPQHSKSLARREASTKGQGERHPKSIRFLREQKDKKGKGKAKEKAKDSLNVLSIVEVLDMSMFSSESINFYSYIKGDRVEWLLDSGCTEHVTPARSDL